MIQVEKAINAEMAEKQAQLAGMAPNMKALEQFDEVNRMPASSYMRPPSQPRRRSARCNFITLLACAGARPPGVDGGRVRLGSDQPEDDGAAVQCAPGAPAIPLPCCCRDRAAAAGVTAAVAAPLSHDHLPYLADFSAREVHGGVHARVQGDRRHLQGPHAGETCENEMNGSPARPHTSARIL